VIVLRFLRTLFGWAFIILDTMVAAIVIGLSGQSEFSERVLRRWAEHFLRITGAQVTVVRHARLDRARSYVFVSNHSSNLDVPAIISVVSHPLRFIAKAELRRIPIFGWAAERMGHVFINRKDRKRATEAIQQRIVRGLSGASLFFFAEGTRSVTDEMLPFKKGAAVAAIETSLDTVPISVAGTRSILKPKGFSLFQPGHVAIVIGEPIAVAGHTLDQRDDLVAVQRAAVEKGLCEARSVLEEIRARAR